MNNDEVVADFRRRYESTYVWLRMEESGKETLVHVDRVESSPSKMAVIHLTSQEYGALTINYGSSDHTLRFKYPPVGVFQRGREAVYFLRRPARQYRRGLCGDNSTMVNVTQQVTGNTVSWSPAEVQAAFDHKIYNGLEALEMLKKKCVSVALPDNYSISRSMTGDSKDHILWHWTNPIARVSEKGTVNKWIEPHYEPVARYLIGG